MGQCQRLYHGGSHEEKESPNNKTIQIRADGNWTIKVHTYNKEGIKVTTNTYEVTRDTVTPEPAVIEVASGTMGDDTYYRSDIDVRLTSQDDTCYKKTTYTVTGTATGAGSIGGVSISSGQNVNISETDIPNGGTFKIQADGRWTIKGYTYDKAGRKSVVAGGIVVTRDTVNPVGNTPVVTSGTQGEAGYYRSNVTVKISGSDTMSFKKMTYRIEGIAKTSGTVAGQSVTANQAVNIGEIDIANNGTFVIATDGTWTVTAYAYDMAGRKGTSSNLVFTRDTVKPTISSFTRIARTSTTINVRASASDALSGIGTTNATYSYYQEENKKGTSNANEFYYTDLTNYTEYNFYVSVFDRAGNESSQYKLTTRTGKLDEFAYTGNIQQYVAPETGTYTLYVAGAQGAAGGEGGTATGQIQLTAGTTLYIVVGQYGENKAGNFNGGGTGGNMRAGGRSNTYCVTLGSSIILREL